MDFIISVQNKDFTGDGKELTKVSRVVGKAKSHIYLQFPIEFGKSREELSWNHCTSTPHKIRNKWDLKEQFGRVKEGTSAVLLQSGLDNEWWADSMEWYSYLRNIQDKLSYGKTLYERRFGMPL